ncbi:MAG: hypothetical protein ACO2YY_09535 [Pseudohongiellaceae bacterium]
MGIIQAVRYNALVSLTRRNSGLYTLNNSIQKIAKDSPGQSALTDIAGTYHDLLR